MLCLSCKAFATMRGGGVTLGDGKCWEGGVWGGTTVKLSL